MPKEKKTNPNVAKTVFKKKITGRKNKKVTKAENDILRQDRQKRKKAAAERLRKAKAAGYKSPTEKKRLAKIAAGKKRFRRLANKN